MRLIDADSIQEELAVMILYLACTPEGECIEYAHNLIDAQPTIDAEPVKHAHWIPDERDTGEGSNTYKCSACGEIQMIIEGTPKENGWRYCPNCGADMRGEQDDESRSNSNAQTDTRARGMGATDKSSGI